MFGSTILDVAVGLVLVYLILAFICSSVREVIAGVLGTRAKLLEQGIKEIFNNDTLTELFYNHPQIASLYRGVNYEKAKDNGDLPSYIPSRNFALALMDIAARGKNIDAKLDGSARVLDLSTARQYVGEIDNARVQRVLLTAIDTAQDDFDKALSSVEKWFDASMDRVSGWYRRRTQGVLLVIGVVVAVAVNADTLRITRHLYTDPASRQAAVAVAGHVVAEGPPRAAAPTSDTVARAARPPERGADTVGTPGTATSRSVDSTTLRHAPEPPESTAGRTPGQPPDAAARVAFARLDSIGVPLGWPDPKFKDEWLLRIVGWIITALAISLGAPFWFDTLNRIMVIRSTVKPHEKSPEEASEDRQRPQTVQVVTGRQAGGGGGGGAPEGGGG